MQNESAQYHSKNNVLGGDGNDYTGRGLLYSFIERKGADSGKDAGQKGQKMAPVRSESGSGDTGGKNHRGHSHPHIEAESLPVELDRSHLGQKTP